MKQRGEEMTDPEKYLPLTALAFDILIALAGGDLHGYGIIKDIEARQDRPSGLRSGTLYTAIQRLHDEGMLEEAAAPEGADVDARRKYYSVTALGRRVASLEAERLRQQLTAASERRLVRGSAG
jgi:DNA-binding PadR family transcriptional regulator